MGTEGAQEAGHHETAAYSRWLMLLPGLLAVLLFLPTLGHGFIFDDRVEMNGFDGLFTPGGWPALFLRAQFQLYRPVKYLTLHFDHALWGGHSLGFHATNVALHAAVCLLVGAALLALGRSRWAALAGAVWFAVHPIHTEAVAWVTARGSMLSAIGVLGAVIAFVGWWRHGRTAWLAVLALAAGSAFFSKEDSLLLLPALLLVGFWAELPRPRPERRRLWSGAAVAVLVPALLYLALRHALLPEVRQGTWAHGFTGLLATLPGIVARYLAQLVVPLDLVLEPPIDYGRGFGLTFWLALLVVGAYASPLFLRGRHWSSVKLAIAWFFLFLLPSLGFIPINAPAADRFLYLPSFAGALLVAAAWERLPARLPGMSRPLAAGFSAVCLFLAAQSVGYARVWRDDATLWGYVVDRNPASYRGWSNLAAEANNHGDYAHGLEWAREALALKPDYAEAYQTAAFALDRSRRPREAEHAYRQALKLNGADPGTQYLLADLLERQGRVGEAAELYETVLRRRPGYVEAHVAAGLLAIRGGDRSHAIEHWESALKYDPHNREAHHNLGLARQEATTP